MGCISPSYVIHTQQLHDDWRRYLAANNLLLEEWCDWNDIEMFRDKVVYKKAFTADYIIACEGALGAENPYFSDVKFHLNKGEAILLSIPDLSENGIYKIGELNIIPQGNNQFWIGSIFNREYTDTKPSDTFKRQVIDALNQSLKLPYKIIGHKAALRPATPGQKPIVGRHPLHPRLCILSGMGSKGYCLAPYFSQQLIAHIYRQQPLSKEVDIARFY
jgi:glycine/D-amino acid oxidase-like deaminating enzyme